MGEKVYNVLGGKGEKGGGTFITLIQTPRHSREEGLVYPPEMRWCGCYGGGEGAEEGGVA